MSAARALIAGSARLWPRVTSHPLLRSIADGTLEGPAFSRWVAADHAYLIEYQRFAAGLLAAAPASYAEVLAAHLQTNQTLLQVVRKTARHHAVDLEVDTGPTTLGFTSYLIALLGRGYQVSLAAMYAAEKVYFDAWSAVAPHTCPDAPYRPLVESWTSERSADSLAGLALLVNSAAPAGPSGEMCAAFDRVVRFELLYWSAIYAGETW